ncbi:MAG TPA: DUF6662 family protein [Lacunisphaera sp.]|nr:DUF6662 family protein [Lacunisphaera sp.]
MKIPTPLRFIIAAALAAYTVGRLPADEETLLGYSEDTEIVPAGQWATYHWITWRTGKSSGTYQVTDYFAEFEHGLTERSQISLYLTAANYHISGVPGLDDRRATQFTGVRGAYKYLLRDHELDGYGLAVYLEPEYTVHSAVSGERHDEFGLETKLIYQLESADQKRNYTANFAVEPEFGREQGTNERELKIEFSHGASFRLMRHWFLGVENRWVAVFDRWQLHHAKAHAGYAGPVLHYGSRHWWFTATWLRQFTGWPVTQHGLALDEFTRNEFRLKFGVEF